MIGRFFFYIQEAFIGMKRSSLMIIISLATIFISLVCFGFFLILNLNLMDMTEHLNSKLEIRVFLKSTLTKKEITYFQSLLTRMDDIDTVTFIDRKDAWVDFKQQYTNLNLETFAIANPLPHSMNVTLGKKAIVEHVATLISGYTPYVDDVVYGAEFARNIKDVSRFILYLGGGLIGVLSLATFLIVINTVRLTIMNRSDEIEIMKLVGATDQFVIAPFLFEGIMLGLFSSGLAVGVIHIVIHFVVANISSYFPFFPYEVSLDRLFFVYITMLVWGGFLTFFGAIFSTRSTLNKIL